MPTRKRRPTSARRRTSKLAALTVTGWLIVLAGPASATSSPELVNTTAAPLTDTVVTPAADTAAGPNVSGFDEPSTLPRTPAADPADSDLEPSLVPPTLVEPPTPTATPAAVPPPAPAEPTPPDTTVTNATPTNPGTPAGEATDGFEPPAPVPTDLPQTATETKTAEAGPTPTATAPPPPPTAVPTVAAPATAAERGAEALNLISYDWQGRLSGWTLRFLPSTNGSVYGLTFVDQRLIEVYVQDSQTAWDIARITAHEMGHAADITYNNSGDRLGWFAARGLSNNTPWWPTPAAQDFATGAGDFAECFATWQTGSTSRSLIAGPCTQAQINLIATLV